jgi:hypothetical protein
MADYLTSSESLEKLCEIQPDNPTKHGLKKTLFGLGLTGFTAGTAWLGWKMRYLIDSPNPPENTVGILLEVVLGVISLAAGWYGLKNLADGITSLAKPLGFYSNDGSVYYRNGGFTNKLSRSDKKFGNKVSPVENIAGLQDIQEGYVLINGLLVKDTNLEEEMKFKGPQPCTQYTVRMDGEFKGQSIRAFTVTEDENFAKSLTKKDSLLYIIGGVEKERGIRVEEFGDAFIRP